VCIQWKLILWYPLDKVFFMRTNFYQTPQNKSEDNTMLMVVVYYIKNDKLIFCLFKTIP